MSEQLERLGPSDLADDPLLELARLTRERSVLNRVADAAMDKTPPSTVGFHLGLGLFLGGLIGGGLPWLLWFLIAAMAAGGR